MRKTVSTAVRKKTKTKLYNGNEYHGGEFNVEGEMIRRMERAGSVERDLPTRKAEPEFFFSFEQTAMQLVGNGQGRELKTSLN